MRPSVVGGVLLLVLHGLLLWLLIPVGTLAWLITLEAVRERPASLGAYLGWIDINLAYVLQRSLLRPFFAKPTVVWVPARERHAVAHRVRLGDFA